MKKIYTILIVSLFLHAFAKGQDSLALKRYDLLAKLNRSFTGMWRFELIDSIEILKWDTAYHLPSSILRANIYLDKKESIDTITTYFFNSRDADTVLSRIIKKNFIDVIKDSSASENAFPHVNSNQQYFATSFNLTEKNIKLLDSKFTTGLQLPVSKIEVNAITIEEITEEEEPPPPPPPPPPKKLKKRKN